MGELHLFSQPGLLLLLWLAAFTLPMAYAASRVVLDGLVDEAAGFVTGLFEPGAPAAPADPHAALALVQGLAFAAGLVHACADTSAARQLGQACLVWFHLP